MLLQRLKAKFITGLLSTAVAVSFLFPAVPVKADEDLDSEEYVEEAYGEGTTAKTSSTKSGEQIPLGTLVAHWTFDGNYNESVSGLKTTLGEKSLTYTEGIFGKAAVFNGKDNYLVVEANSILNLGNSRDTDNNNFTISAWINLGDSKSGEKYLLDKGSSSNWDKNDDCYWTNPYRISFERCETTVALSNGFQDTSKEYNINTEGEARLSGKYVEGGEWFLLTVTYDGKRVKVYYNNELLNQTNYTDGIAFNEEDLYIGTDYRLENLFKGAVDDLRLYTKTLSYDEVNELYQNGLKSNKEFLQPKKQLVAYYAFDGDLKDSSIFKNNAEKVAVQGTTKYVVGKNGKAITMSKGNYILVPAADQLNFETEFTISSWIKADKAGEYPILYRQNPSDSDDNDNEFTYRLALYSTDTFEDSQVHMYTKAYDPNDWAPATGQYLTMEFSTAEQKIKSNSWFHYTVTYKDGQMSAYLNGKLINKSNKSDLIDIYNASGDLLIGFDGDTFFTGALDELKIYNKCLSATEIAKEAKRVDSISLSDKDRKALTTLGKGKTITLNGVKLKDGDTGKESTVKKDITYKSSNTKIFTVSKTGQLKGVKAGKAKLTVTYGGNTATYDVVVK